MGIEQVCLLQFRDIQLEIGKRIDLACQDEMNGGETVRKLGQL